jgi:hypothetical protein
MQNYKEINGNDYVKDSRTTINETMRSIQSMNSGTAFPTTNLFEGMKCYRTDLKKTYTLTDVENNTWVEDAHAELADEATHAASATKLQTPRALNLSGAVTADAASFDGTADATINVKTLDASKLKGTASVSTTGNAATATKLATARTIALSGNATGSTTFDGSGNATINVTVNESAHAAKATQVVATAPAGGGLDIIHAIMGGNDAARVRVYVDTNNGALEIATGDDGTEPIYARQYVNSSIDKFTTVAHTAAILDGNGNTSFPGTVTAASFTGPLNGNAATATNSAAANALNIGTYRPTDANVQYGDGKIRYFLATSNMSKNKPPAGDGQIIDLAWDNNGGYDAQLCINNTTGRLNMRGQSAGKWSDWLIGLDSGNFNNYAPTKTGVGASGTWNINISGTATNATKATTAAACSGNSATTTTLNNRGNRNPAANGTKVASGLNLYQVYNNGYPTAYGNVLSIGGTGGGEILAGWSGADAGIERLYYRNQRDTGTLAWSAWKTVAYTDDISNYAPSKTGSGASGTWNINVSGNAATATKATSATTAATCTGNSATASKLATARSIALTGNATGSAKFDGSGNISISTNVNIATNADKVDGYHESSFLRYRGDAAANGEDTYWSQIGIKRYEGNLPQGISGTYNYGGVVSLPAGAGARLDIWYNHQCSTNGDGLWYRSGYSTDKKAWARLLDSVNYTKYAPTKTGSGASGTWPISISGTATNADKVDGYHASDIINRITAANTGGIVAASLTANGYVKFANGLILQWGNNGNNNSVAFPIAFSSFAKVVATSTTSDWTWAVPNDLKSFKIRVANTANWLAFGV